MARRYELKQRAEKLEQTRRRILEATLAMHLTRGPAATDIAEIARQAGVQRRTVYNHFPNERELLGACSGHWRALHPAPDPGGWLTIEEPAVRRRQVLEDLYRWYRETEPMTANVLRDAELMPALREIIDSGLGAYLGAVGEILSGSVRARGRRRERAAAAARAAIDFHFWRAVAPLGDHDAAAIGAGMIELASRRKFSDPIG